MSQQPSWFAQPQPQHLSKLHSPKTVGRIILKIVLYFIGAFIAEFGFLGGALLASGSSTPVGCIVFSSGIVALIGSIFVFFVRGYYIHCLPRLQYLWWILGASIADLIILVIAFVITGASTDPITTAIVADSLALYGLSLIWIAHLKPSLSQQINESVYHIVKRTPGEQILVSDLLARLQKIYKREGSTLHQYFGSLEYIEQVSIPGAPGLICRMKSQRQVVAVAPMTPPPANISRPQVAPMPQPFPMPVKQIVTPPPGRTNLPTNPKPKETNRSLADLETVPVLPVAIPTQTPISLPVQHVAQFALKPINAFRSFPAQNVISSSPKPIDTPPIQHVTSPNPKSAGALTPPPNRAVSPTPFVPNSPEPPLPVVKEQKAIQIFCCYVHKDEQLLNKLKAHLQPQQRQGLIHIWHDRDISAGAVWEEEIEEQLNTAQIILLLISSDFIASDYCYTKEMQRVLERHARGEVRAIPIILRPIDWKITPLGKLHALPKDGKPITTWSNRDNAYLDVATGIRAVVETFFVPPQRPQKQVKPLNNIQRVDAEVELIRSRCTQGKLIVTNKKIAIELTSFGKVLKSQILLRSSLTSIDSKLAVLPVLGMGGGMNLTFHGKGREVLKAELIPLKEAQEVLALLS